MSYISAIGLRGMQQGFELAAKSAQEITAAFQPDSTTDPVGPMVDLMEAKHQVKASAAVIRTDKELSDSILDILA